MTLFFHIPRQASQALRAAPGGMLQQQRFGVLGSMGAMTVWGPKQLQLLMLLCDRVTAMMLAHSAF